MCGNFAEGNLNNHVNYMAMIYKQKIKLKADKWILKINPFVNLSQEDIKGSPQR